MVRSFAVEAEEEGVRVVGDCLLTSAKDVEDLTIVLWRAKEEVFGETDPDKPEFTIDVTEIEGTEKMMVRIGSDDPDFIYWMCACEYFLHKVAKKSQLPYEEALRTLCAGAMTYRDVD